MSDTVLLVSEDLGPAGSSVMLRHDAGPGHPERPDRLRAAWRALTEEPPGAVQRMPPRSAEREWLERVHTSEYVSMLESCRGQSFNLDVDTSGSPETIGAAHLGAGAAVQLVEALVRDSFRRGLALVRPPGHHAERGKGMGFCYFNNIAVAAAHAVSALGISRVLIVDWDVHHGNGTQHIFEHRSDVLVFNVHEHGNYPGTGAIEEVGTGDGAGFTINVPFPAGCGDAEYAAAFRDVLRPVADAWRPELVLVSAGFDAHMRDPLGHMRLTEHGFAALCGVVRQIADAHAGGRLGLVLEGGYDLEGLASGVRACVGVLSGMKAPAPAGAAHPLALRVIDDVRAAHSPFWSCLAPRVR